MTTLLGPSPTTGPSVLMWSLSCRPMPWKPVSEAPTESVNTALGKASIQRSFTGGAEDRGAAGDREQAGAVVRRAGGGLALVLLDQRPRHRVTGHEDQLDLLALDDLPGPLGVELRLEDRQVAGEQVHQQAGLRTAVHQRAQREGDHPRVVGLLGLVELLERLAGVEVDAAAEHPPEVLVAPHHALGEAGRATGVDDVQVVGAALREVPLVALALEGVLERDAAERREVRVVVGVEHVRDRDEGVQLLVLRRAGRDERGVGALVDQRHDVGVVEEVVELPLDVAVVHVDVDGADLHHGEYGDDVLDAVLGVDADVVTRCRCPARPGSGRACWPRASSSA